MLQVKKYNAKGSVDSVRREMITKMKIPLPPIKEQQKIADILSTVDEKIEVIDARISQTEELKKGLMQQLLTKGIGHTKFKNSELGEIPDSWEVVAWEDVCEIYYGKEQKGIEDPNGPYGIYGTGGLMGFTSSFLCDEPSVLIGRKGTIDKPFFLDKPFWTVDTLFYTKIKDRNFAKWFYYAVANTPLKKYNEATGVPSLSRSNIYTIKIFRPPLSEQKKIADILSVVDEKLEVLQAKKENFEELKKGLMQTLLTGKVRVKVN
jgi:type I restriction enzyme S subunit